MAIDADHAEHSFMKRNTTQKQIEHVKSSELYYLGFAIPLLRQHFSQEVIRVWFLNEQKLHCHDVVAKERQKSLAHSIYIHHAIQRSHPILHCVHCCNHYHKRTCKMKFHHSYTVLSEIILSLVLSILP